MADQPKYPIFGPINGQIGPIVEDIKVDVGILAAGPNGSITEEKRGEAFSSTHGRTSEIHHSKNFPTIRV
jgi:hypothetical protein